MISRLIETLRRSTLPSSRFGLGLHLANCRRTRIALVSVMLVSVACIVSTSDVLANDDASENRLQRLAKMSPIEKERLRQQQERFLKLPSEQQSQLRKLDSAIATDDHADRLRQVMNSYNDWLSALPSDERVALLSLPTDQRIDRIKEILEQQEQERFAELFDSKLQPSDQKVLIEWVHRLITRQEEQILQHLTSMELQRLMRVEDIAQRRMLMAMLLRWKSRNIRLFELLQPTPEDLSQLSASLSALARDTLAAARDDKEREKLIQMWARTVIDNRARPAATKEELQRFLRDIATDDQRVYLESLPPERMRFELQRLYFKHGFDGTSRQTSPRPGGGFTNPGSGRRGVSGRDRRQGKTD